MAENYQYASLEYERVVFEERDPNIINEALLKKGLCHKALRNFSQAYSTLDRANLFIAQDSLNYQIRYEKALTAYLSQQYNLVVSQALQINHFYKNDGYDEIMFLHILALNELRKWEEAKILFDEYLSMNHKNNDNQDLYSFVNKTKLKDPEKAVKISYLMSGIGMIYAGYLGRGIVSSLISASLFTYGIYGISSGYYYTGAFLGIGTFWMLNTASFEVVRQLAIEKNQKLTNKYNSPIRQTILEIENHKLNKKGSIN
ncbi:hypothetical protein [Fulvivirga lutimaris]|uniref:hypothetical protein n=1 Tax=Fulvivirga lutimaris TaxID=1819566 RepID=UPI0012BCC4F7|nr:hypothetical protein [Fulvivirga lutimaris]MTI37953.1 hypothetical protein [Fulvivirga lutimaris]